MKRLSKKIAALCLTLVMALSLAAPALAAEEVTPYPPIEKISVDYPGGVVNVTQNMVENDAGDQVVKDLTYTVILPGGNAASLKNRTLSFTIGGGTAPLAGKATIICGGVSGAGSAGEVVRLPLNLSAQAQDLTVTWTDSFGRNMKAVCKLAAETPAANVNITHLTIGGKAAVYDSSSVGGVTRHTYAAELDAGAALTGLTMVVTLPSATAKAKLGAAEASYGTSGGSRTATFTGLDFRGGVKTLTISDGGVSRDYAVSAYAAGETVTVHMAIRTFLINCWMYDGETPLGYDYIQEGFDSAGWEEDKWPEYEDAAAALSLWQTFDDIYEGEKGRKYIFKEDSYVDITVDAGSSVMDALQVYLDKNGLVGVGLESNYVSSMGDGSNMVGEFDCGYGSGWMYTVRNTINDTESPLPNMGACYWPVSGGEYIDWYYTCAYGDDFGYSISAI